MRKQQTTSRSVIWGKFLCPASDLDPPTSVSHVAGNTGMYYHAWHSRNIYELIEGKSLVQHHQLVRSKLIRQQWVPFLHQSHGAFYPLSL
jgi:hypothetical protein